MNIRKLKIWFRRAVHAVKINKSIGRGNITLKKHHSYNKKSEAEETRWTEVFQRSRVAGGMWAPPERWRGRESARGEEAARPLPRRCFTCGETFQPQETSWPSQPVPRHLTPATRLAATASGRRVSALECSKVLSAEAQEVSPVWAPRGACVPSLWHPCASQHWGGGRRAWVEMSSLPVPATDGMCKSAPTNEPNRLPHF